MSIQQGINQLLGSSTALLSLNPAVQEGVREQGELRKLNRQEKGFKKQVESALPALAENTQAVRDVLDVMENDRENLNPEQVKELEKQYITSKSTAEALGEQLQSFEKQGVDIAEQKFGLRPNVANFENLIGWKAAKYRQIAQQEFMQLGQNSVKQRDDFNQLRESLSQDEDFNRLGKSAQNYIISTIAKEDRNGK